MMAIDLAGSLRKLRWAKLLFGANPFAPFLIPHLVSLDIDQGSALLLFSVMKLVSGPLQEPTGRFADWAGRKVSLVVGSSCCFGSMAIFCLARNWPYMVAAALMLTVGKVFFSGADRALITNTLLQNADKNGRGWSKLARQSNLGELTCGLAVSVLAAWLGLYVVVIIQSVFYLVMLMLVISLRELPHRQEETKSGEQQSGEAKRARHWELNALLVYLGAMASMNMCVYALLPLFYGSIRHHGHPLPMSGYGWVWTAYMALMWAFGYGCRLAERFRPRGYLRTLALLAVIGIGCYGIMASVPSIAGLMLAVPGLALMRALEPIDTRAINELADPKSLARVFSRVTMVQEVMSAGCLLLVYWVINGYGLQAGLMAAQIIHAMVVVASTQVMCYFYGKRA